MFRFLMVLGLFMLPAVAAGQGFALVDQLTALNRIPPLQHPEFSRAEQVLSRRILDRKNRTLGEVQDVILNENGTIDSLLVELDRLRLPPLSLNYREVVDRPSSKGYILRLSDDQLEERYPAWLASIETAAGEGANLISTKHLLGALVEAEDGRRLGVVRDILFDEDGRRASALYVESRMGMMRGDHIAVPIGMVQIRDRQGHKKKMVRVSPAAAEAMIAVLKEKG